jgi:hypothetical protein
MAKDSTPSTTDYWFKRRRYGFGFTPTTWQGWVTIAAFVVLAIIAVLQLKTDVNNTAGLSFLRFLGIFLIALSLLLIATALKAPEPHWRGGKKPTDNPAEDY